MDYTDTIYLDNNATTLLDEQVYRAMQPFLTTLVGNPSSQHGAGRTARRAMDQARRQILGALHAADAQFVFTSGATEANNLALASLVGDAGSHVLVSPAEHPSVLQTIRAFNKSGVEVEEIPLDSEGRVLPTEVRNRIRPQTRLVAIQYANSETGCVQDIASLSSVMPPHCHLHCDAVQAVGKIPVDWRDIGAATLAISGHKLHGPTGIGALLAKPTVALRPQWQGGHQQGGIRPGTEAVAAIVGFGHAVDLACAVLPSASATMSARRDQLEQRLLKNVFGCRVHGAGAPRLPNTTNIAFDGCRAEALLMALDLAGVYCSAGTACASGSLQASPTLLAMGIPEDEARSTLRFSVSRFTTPEQVDAAVARIVPAVEQVRQSFHKKTPRK